MRYCTGSGSGVCRLCMRPGVAARLRRSRRWPRVAGAAEGEWGGLYVGGVGCAVGREPSAIPDEKHAVRANLRCDCVL